MIRRFLREEKGQDVIEWGLLASFLGIGILLGFTWFDVPTKVAAWYTLVSDAIEGI